METIGTPEEIEALPGWAREFLDAAWDAPDSANHRAALPAFPDMKRIAGQFAIGLDTASREPGAVDHHVTFTITEQGGAFVEALFVNDPVVEACRTIMKAWSGRRSIAPCQNCGTLMVPSRGKVAIYCSARCRMASHRKAG
jgi:hypothetical protein